MELLVALEEAVQLVGIPASFAIFQDLKRVVEVLPKGDLQKWVAVVQWAMAKITKDTNTPATWCPFS